MSLLSKTSEVLGLTGMQGLISEALAIDMGSASTIIGVRGKGVVVDEPSLIAVDSTTGQVIAVGTDAQRKYGREARGVTVIAPLRNGVVADFERTQQMLSSFVSRARGRFPHFKRPGLISAFSDATPVELRALVSAAHHARIGRIGLIEEGLAAALGAGVRADDPRGSAVVDIGGSTTNVAIVASGKIVHLRGQRIGSWDINAAIINHVRRHRGLLIGAHTAELLKLQLASATLPVDLAEEITIKGRDVLTGNPSSIEIASGEIYPVAQEVVRKTAEGIRNTLADVPAEISGDIYDRGIILTGGGSLFGGLDDYLRDQTKLLVRIADEPRFAVVRGLELMLQRPFDLSRVMNETQLAPELEWSADHVSDADM